MQIYVKHILDGARSGDHRFLRCSNMAGYLAPKSDPTNTQTIREGRQVHSVSSLPPVLQSQ
jgi:hypothetical protein